MKSAALFIAAGAFFAFAAPAHAQLSESGGPVSYSADNLEYFDGEQLVGAKQNRILNTDVIVPAHSKLSIPVSCVEAGRWDGRRHSENFEPAPQAAYPELRRAKAAQVREQAATPDLWLLFAPIKRGRIDWLVEKATELGVTAWRPVMFERSRSVSPRGEGEAFAAKVRARMIGALEQSGGAWLPAVHPPCEVGDAAQDARMPARFLLQAGAPRLDAAHAASGAAVILGPEGGITPEEQATLAAAGWVPAALAAGTLRFETAAVAALAIIRASHLPAVT